MRSRPPAACSNFAFNQLHARKVIALIDPLNARSISLVYKLGMQFDRVVRMKRGNRGADVLRYVRDA